MLCLGQKARRAVGLVAAIERLHRLVHSLGQPFGVLQQLAALLQCLVLPRLQLRFFDFGDLVFQRLHPAKLLSLVHGHVLNFPTQGGHALVFFPIGLPQAAIVSKIIQEDQVVFFVKQRRGIVLAVDIDQLDAQPAQHGHGDQSPVDPAYILAVQENIPLDHRLRVIGHPVLGKPREFRHLGEHGADGGLVCPGADHIPVGPLTQDGGDGVDHNGFARARLAGEHIEARVKRDIRALDNRDILNMQKIQHGSSPLITCYLISP